MTIAIPTYNRKGVLIETLASLDEQDGDFEVIVVDDGSTDGTLEALRKIRDQLKSEITFLMQPNRGPAAARNHALRAASGEICLFLGDDMRATPGLVERHLEFHRRHPAPEDALLGRVDWAPDIPPTPFMEWLETSGIQFGFDQIEQGSTDGTVPGRYFFTSNVSAKIDLIERNGGFDESFPDAAVEDVELGMRLEGDGMRLTYDPSARVEHFHPTDLAGAINRMRKVGSARRILAERSPDAARPALPGPRHRIGAACLTVATMLPGLGKHVREETWRFLCHEAHREGFWLIAPRAGEPLRIGAALAHRAMRDPEARLSG